MRDYVFWGLACVFSATAHADPCKEAFTESSTMSSSGRLLAAESQLRTCAASACPAKMRSLCVHDLEALEPRLPSVVLGAKHPATHEDLVDVRVLVDSRVFQERLDGIARTLDPGLHTFRFEPKALAPVEMSVLIREGEKDRVITAEWQAGAPSFAQAHRPIPVRAWITGGFTVAAIGIWAAAGITGFVKEANLDSCKATRSCSPSAVQSTELSFNAADVAGAAALALGALTAVFVLTRPNEGPKSVSLCVGGSRLVLEGTF